MLTQCVIIFDEFEPVLKNRKKDDILLSEKDESKWDEKGIRYDTMRMSEAIQKISQSDDLKFRFVLSGMLPKFGKLHDSAENQSFIYCLGTNIFNDIDEAAKRSGRFDKYFPVYKPDTLSRAGKLLYRLSKSLYKSRKNNYQTDSEIIFQANSVHIQRFAQIIAITANQDAGRINSLFSDNEKDANKSYLPYILLEDSSQKSFEDLTKEKIMSESEKEITDLEYDLTHNASVDDDEKKEREFIINFEKKFAASLENSEDLTTIDLLKKYLSGEGIS